MRLPESLSRMIRASRRTALSQLSPPSIRRSAVRRGKISRVAPGGRRPGIPRVTLRRK